MGFLLFMSPSTHGGWRKSDIKETVSAPCDVTVIGSDFR